MSSRALSKTAEKSTPKSASRFEELYYGFYSQVHKLASFNAGSNNADDITQEVFYKIYKKADSFQEEAQFKTWIYRITLNTCYDFLRKKQRRQKLFSLLRQQSQTHQNHTNTSEKSDQKRALEAAVFKLDDKHRSVFTLFYFSELKISEIADTLGLAEGTVKSRLTNAKAKIKKILGKNLEQEASNAQK